MIWTCDFKLSTCSPAALGACVVAALAALPVALAVRASAREGARACARARRAQRQVCALWLLPHAFIGAVLAPWTHALGALGVAGAAAWAARFGHERV